MPKQEVFFEQNVSGARVEVIKSYDQAYAREAFREMDGAALKMLWTSLSLENSYERADLPSLGNPEGDGEDFLWEELLDSAREVGNKRSFFIVNEKIAGHESSLYVSPDWPSAEAFAKQRLSSMHQ
jgi:hypothetical protein